MTLHYGFIIFLSLLITCESQPTNHPFNRTDIQAAAADIRSKSYYGFAILLQMLNGTSEPYQDLTFLIPGDAEISQLSISPNQLEEFLLRHSIRMPLSFMDMSHFPTGTLVPSGYQGRMIRIHNQRSGYFVNNAQVIVPNVCVNSKIKCHGIDAVIDNDSYARNYREIKNGKVASNCNAQPPRRSPVPKV